LRLEGGEFPLKRITFTDPNGNPITVLAGQSGAVTYTNVATDESLTFRSRGTALRITEMSDGTQLLESPTRRAGRDAGQGSSRSLVYRRETGMRKLRTAIAAAILAALTLTAAESAVADEPLILPAGLACPDFNLGISSSGGNLHTKEFLDRDGNVVRIITAGKGVLLTYTNYGPDPANPVAGTSVTIRTDGSVSNTTVNPDGTQTVTATGHNGLVLFPTDIPAGPTTTQYIGRIVYTIDPTTGVFTLLSTSGSQRDICAELAN
jgi:hypothetical protein